MFPRGLCEAGDIIEERWALLNSQAYYQSLSLVLIHTRVSHSLSTTRWLRFSLSLNLVPHSTVAQRASAPPVPLSSGNKGSKYILLLFLFPSTAHSTVLQSARPSYDSHTRRAVVWCSVLFLVNSFHQKDKDNVNHPTSELDKKQILCQLY